MYLIWYDMKYMIWYIILRSVDDMIYHLSVTSDSNICADCNYRAGQKPYSIRKTIIIVDINRATKILPSLI